MITMPKEAFLYQINTNRYCNLRCTHCYIEPKQLSAKDKPNISMSKENFLLTIDQIVKHHKTTGSEYDRVEIHVIGGEPTMLGYDYFADVIPLAKEKLAVLNKEIYFGIVSNLVDRGAVEICKMFDSICTSFEQGTRFTKEEIEKRWKGRSDELINTGLNVNVNVSVTRQACETGPDAIMEMLTEVGFREIYFGPFIPTSGNPNSAKILPAFGDTSDFMIGVDLWCKKNFDRFPDLIVNPHNSIIDAIQNNDSTNYIACQILSGSLDINWNGKVVTCTAEGGGESPNWLGNIFDDSSIIEILESDSYMKEYTKAARMKKECMGCDEWNLCRSGCGLIFDYWDGTGECPGFKKFLKHMRKYCD